MSSFDASEVTDLKQSLGAFKYKFRCAIPEFTEASPNYSFHEFVVTEPTCKDEDNMTLLYKEVHTYAESAMGSPSVKDFDDGLSTCSSLDGVLEADLEDNKDFDGDAIWHPMSHAICILDFQHLNLFLVVFGSSCGCMEWLQWYVKWQRLWHEGASRMGVLEFWHAYVGECNLALAKQTNINVLSTNALHISIQQTC